LEKIPVPVPRVTEEGTGEAGHFQTVAHGVGRQVVVPEVVVEARVVDRGETGRAQADIVHPRLPARVGLTGPVPNNSQYPQEDEARLRRAFSFVGGEFWVKRAFV
jgi:hypothetical protein